MRSYIFAKSELRGANYGFPCRSCHKLRTVMDRVAKRLPIATEPEEEKYDETVSLPTTVRVATRIYPQVKLLEEGLQDLSVAIEIESLLHNRNVLSDSTVDLVFVIDNR